MKIDLYSYELFLNFFSWKIRKGLLVCIDGHWGEIAPLKGFSKEGYTQAKKQTIKICIYLIHKKKFPFAIFPSVFFGFYSAFSLLNQRKMLPICSLGIGNTSCMKIKLSSFSVDQSIVTVKKIQNTYPYRSLRLDINKKWSLKEALYFAKHFKKEDFSYIEEPCATSEELYEFSTETLFPIALDETLQKKTFCYQKIKNLKAFVLKPTLLAQKQLVYLISYALKHKIDLVFSSCFESGIGIQNIASLASLFSVNTPQGLDTIKYFKQDLLEKPLDLNKKEDTIFIKPNKKNIKHIASWKTKSSVVPLELLEIFTLLKQL